MQNRLFLCGISICTLLIASCKKDNSDDNTTNNLNSQPTITTVTDIDGNVYKTITIGTQVWMAENLQTTHYRNGDTIPNIVSTASWQNLNFGAYCNYNNDTSFVKTYGRLYNYYAITDTRNIAPSGWRVANFDDWRALINYLGGDSIAGNKLKEAGTSHWVSPNAATNSSGFTALPAGTRTVPIITFQYLMNRASYWTNQDLIPRSHSIQSDGIIFHGLSVNVPYSAGHSIRCIKE